MKSASIAVCGSYFGIIIFPNGKSAQRRWINSMSRANGIRTDILPIFLPAIQPE